MAWWLVDSIINGTLDEEYPIMSKNNDDVIVFGKEEDSSQDFWKDDGYSLTGNPDPYDYYGEGGAFSFAGTPKFSSASSDTITLGPTRLKGGMGEDHISIDWNAYAGMAKTHSDEPKYYSDEHGLVAGELPDDKDDK
mgnify:FL=1